MHLKSSDAGHIQYLSGPHVARGSQVSHSCFKPTPLKQMRIGRSLYDLMTSCVDDVMRRWRHYTQAKKAIKSWFFKVLNGSESSNLFTRHIKNRTQVTQIDRSQFNFKFNKWTNNKLPQYCRDGRLRSDHGRSSSQAATPDIIRSLKNNEIKVYGVLKF